MNKLIQKIVEDYVEDYNDEDKEFILKAFNFARNAHEGQKRASGEEYIYHPLRAAHTLSKLNLDSKTIAACFLHDVVDDTGTTLKAIEENFGKEVALMVDGVSKLGKIRYPRDPIQIQPIEKHAKNLIDLQAENLRKMFFLMAENIGVVLIKLADRLDNMETLNYLPQEKQKRIAMETLEIFAPIANRLGMGEIKGRLEDLSFPYLYPKEYQWLKENVKGKYEERKKYLERVQPILKKMLEEEGIKIIDIHQRAKHYWSLYQKLLHYEMDLEKIYDLVALRMIVEDIETCYRALGVIHKHWKPLPGRIKDYIALPKPSGYQSLHTTVFCEQGQITEIQIRTPKMHEEAEYGIAAHWAWKEGVGEKDQKKDFAWVKQLRDWQKDIAGSKEFFQGLKADFFKNRIFVFTPKGDVIDLPEGATPIDFAYAIHSEVGNRYEGAKVNGKIVSLSHILKNSDLVEIVTDKNKSPSRKWLKYAKTSLARSNIQKRMKKSFLETLSEKISPAKVAEKIFKREKPRISITIPSKIQKYAKQAASLILPKKIEKHPKNVIIGGETGIALSFAKCCDPQPGDIIKAYITNKKVSIHKITCENFGKAERKWPEKVVEASWRV